MAYKESALRWVNQNLYYTKFLLKYLCSYRWTFEEWKFIFKFSQNGYTKVIKLKDLGIKVISSNTMLQTDEWIHPYTGGRWNLEHFTDSIK